MKMTFKTYNAWTIFCAMAEGMSEVAEDSGEKDRCFVLDTMISIIGEQVEPDMTYPLSLELDDVPGEVAAAVLENCLDTASGAAADDPDVLHAGDVTIDPDETEG